MASLVKERSDEEKKKDDVNYVITRCIAMYRGPNCNSIFILFTLFHVSVSFCSHCSLCCAVSGYIMRLSDNRRDLNERMFDYAPNVTLMDVTDVLKEANVFQDAGKVVSVQLAIQSSVERRSRRSNQYFVALRAVDDYGNKRQEAQ